MSREDHERFEAYLELERYIEELQAGHIAHPPGELTPAQARIYRMAALFRSASSEEATPRPAFVAALLAHLEQERQQPLQTHLFPFLPQGRSHVSRRALLAGGAAVAASLVVLLLSASLFEAAIAPQEWRKYHAACTDCAR